MNRETPRRVLVIDDEEDVRTYLATALEDVGFTVEVACDGLDGLEKARRCPPDLISLDLVMPKHSGMKFYREIQKDHALARIPVLLVTGHARDEMGKADFEEMTLSGRGVYLEKPVRPATYVNAVCRMLGMEAVVPAEPKQQQLREEIERALSGADRDALQHALDALKHK